MKPAYLFMFNTLIHLNNNQFYHFDGPVPDLKKHTENLRKKYSVKKKIEKKEWEKLSGRCYYKKKNGIQQVHIYSKLGINDKYQVFALAHEETHAVRIFNKENYISDIFQKEGIELRLEDIADQEIAANIGAIYVCKRVNINLWEIFTNYQPMKMLDALQLYEAADFSKRTKNK